MASGNPLAMGARRAEPVYLQTTDALRRLALACPWDGEGVMPAETALMQMFGVSRGTLRRASESLVREGLLRPEPGRGTFVNRREQVRAIAREALRAIALPDSRWHLDVDEFVPDFEGSEQCLDHLAALPAYAGARSLYVTPDNSTERLRRRALDEGKSVLTSTFGQRRGMVLLDPTDIAPERRELAATLDGMERCGRTLSLAELYALPAVDLLVTGAFAVTTDGVHVNSHADYLDLEWGLLVELGLVAAQTTVVAVVHPSQVIDVALAPQPHEITVDLMATPAGIVATTGSFHRPASLHWRRNSRDADGTAHPSPYLAELDARDGAGSGPSSEVPPWPGTSSSHLARSST